MVDRTMLLWDEADGRGGGERHGSLETQLALPREAWGVEDLVRFARNTGVRLISLMHVGGDGWLKSLDFVPRSDDHLEDILRGGERADGSSIFRGLGIPAGESDVTLRPRIASAFLNPFTEERTLVVMCGHADREGRPLAQSPDTIVRRAWRHLFDETGVQLWALGEVEFFLGKRADESDVYGADENGYHATAPFVFGEHLRRQAMIALADIGIPVKYGHSEVGYLGATEPGGRIWEQHEIELDLLPLPDAAEAIVLTQWVVRSLAHARGMQCATAPVMGEGHAGNGLHIHLAPRVRGVDQGGRGADGALTEATRWLLGGLVRHGGALMAFGNRTPDSFVRLGQGKEAPEAIVWGEFDRSALVRLPVLARTEDGRAVTPPTVEFRLPDGSAHPHLVMAGLAQAMVDGRSIDDLDDLLARTRSQAVMDGRGAAEAIPLGFEAIGAALADRRAVFEAGGTFPATLLDTTIERLGRGQPPA